LKQFCFRISDQPFQSDGHGQEDGSRHGNGVQRIEEIGKDDYSKFCFCSKMVAERLTQRVQKVDIVERGQSDEQQVEGVPHI